MSQSVKYNLNQKGKRKTLYDRDGYSRDAQSYKYLDDHKVMKGHVFADFQKEQFRKKRIALKKRYQLYVIVAIITILIILSFLYGWNNYDFSILEATSYPKD